MLVLDDVRKGPSVITTSEVDATRSADVKRLWFTVWFNTHNSAIASADNTSLSQIGAIDDLYQALQGPHTYKTQLYCNWQAIKMSVYWNSLVESISIDK